jgi:hypothetical protein
MNEFGYVLDKSSDICSAVDLVILVVYDAASVAARFLADAASQPRRIGSFVLGSEYININSSGGLGIETHGKTDTNFDVY